jgi:hypothetical protein
VIMWQMKRKYTFSCSNPPFQRAEFHLPQRSTKTGTERCFVEGWRKGN